MGEQMQQIREQICAWVALGKPAGGASGRTERRLLRKGGEGKVSFSLLILQGLPNKNLAC